MTLAGACSKGGRGQISAALQKIPPPPQFPITLYFYIILCMFLLRYYLQK